MKDRTSPASSLDFRHATEAHTWARLYVGNPLKTAETLMLSADQSHYLQHVLRVKPNAPLRLFNGSDGDWKAVLIIYHKKGAEVEIEEQLRPQQQEPDLWLCCAPIKKQHFDDILMKATELGVAAIRPILTSRTQIRDVNLSRAKAIMIEAAEQSERLTIPMIYEPIRLEKMLESWPSDRLGLLCAESGKARGINEVLTSLPLELRSKVAVFTGPEGGFSREELEIMARIPSFYALRLGPRILRADTAALAALSCWQSCCGDWS